MSLGVVNGTDLVSAVGTAVQSAQLGAPSGVATLNGSSKVVQDPASRGAANGVASLDGSTKVPSAQITGVLASTDLTNDAALEKVANKGAASGYASLNGSSLVVQNPASASTTPGNAVIPIADTNGRLADGFTPFAVPRWKKFTKTFSDLSFAGLTNDIEVYSLAAAEIIHGIKIKHSTAFSGGAIASYTLSVGISGDLTKYASAFDVFQATSNTTFQLSNTFGSENHGAATSIRLAAVATGANLDQAAAGSVDVWILVSGAV